MNNNVAELQKIISQFEKDLKKIRDAAHKEVRRARAILKKIEKEKPPR